MSDPDDVLTFADAAAWAAWLEEHHHGPRRWLRIAKKHAGRSVMSGIPVISIEDAGDTAICFGWIDGQRRGLDAVSFRQSYGPRRRRSTWSAVNVERVARLTAEGRMRPSGLAEVAAARSDGRWAVAYEPQRSASTPADLAVALAAAPVAEAAYAALGRTERYTRSLPVLQATTAAARARAVARLVASLT